MQKIKDTYKKNDPCFAPAIEVWNDDRLGWELVLVHEKPYKITLNIQPESSFDAW